MDRSTTLGGACTYTCPSSSTNRYTRVINQQRDVLMRELSVLYVIVELARKFRLQAKLRRCRKTKKQPSDEALPAVESAYHSMDSARSAADDVSIAIPTSPRQMSSSPEQVSPPGAEHPSEGGLPSS
eukprot:4630979-Amphidinium_carterae.1